MPPAVAFKAPILAPSLQWHPWDQSSRLLVSRPVSQQHANVSPQHDGGVVFDHLMSFFMFRCNVILVLLRQ